MTYAHVINFKIELHDFKHVIHKLLQNTNGSIQKY